MATDDSLTHAMAEEVHLTAHESQWTAQFVAERDRLFALLPGRFAALPVRRWLMRHASGPRTHHLHLVVFGGEQWVRHLQFRDVLRAEAVIAARSEHLKRGRSTAQTLFTARVRG